MRAGDLMHWQRCVTVALGAALICLPALAAPERAPPPRDRPAWAPLPASGKVSHGESEAPAAVPAPSRRAGAPPAVAARRFPVSLVLGPDGRVAAVPPEPPAPTHGRARLPMPPPRPADLGGLRRAMLVTVLESETGRRALLRLPGGRVLPVTSGVEVRGWRVGHIGEDRLRLTQGRRVLELTLPPR